MATMRAADSWQQAGGRYDRPPMPHTDRSMPIDRAVPGDRARARGYDRPPVPQRRRTDERDWRPEREMRREAADYRAGSRDTGRTAVSRSRSAGWVEQEAPPRGGRRPKAAPQSGRLRGIVAVLLVFLVSLAGAAVDSFVGTGLGTVTLAAMLLSTAIAAVMVRRRDLLTVVVAPPLVFVAVELVNIAAAPSASLNLPTVATLLIRGFPAMGVATGAAVLIGLVRLAARR